MEPEVPRPGQIPDQSRGGNPLQPGSIRLSSPATQPTPQLQAGHDSDGDEPLTGSAEEDVASGLETPKMGAEPLAEKRKMKRFRLTAAQTIYLTNEFSCQPRPDAAHRERLSQDIPGLNPRQVQVWFQNRRAKLKRLTANNQERMITSRTFPEDSDFSQTVHPTFREARPLYGSTFPDSIMFEGGVSQVPSLQTGIGHLSTASNSMNSSFTSHVPSLVPMTDSTSLSPTSSFNEQLQRSGPYFLATEKSSQANGMGMNQYCISPLSSPTSTSYHPSHRLYPSGSGFPETAYYQSPGSVFGQESQMNPQGYQRRQKLQPHHTTNQRHESESSLGPFSQTQPFEK